MTKWNETQEASDFIATGNNRETSKEIMEAIAFFAESADEAETLWNGDGFGVICHPSDLWEKVTKNGLTEASEYNWGASGSHWWPSIDGR